MDDPRRARLKIYAHVDPVPLDDAPALAAAVAVKPYKAKPERIVRLHLESFDWNCAQHITPRFTQRETTDAVRPLQYRLVVRQFDYIPNSSDDARVAAYC